MTTSLKWLVVGFGLWFSLAVCPAEDWTTTDGKTYKNVKVVKVEDDAVTILDEDGGARVPLATLPPDLQKKFNYDPVKAAAARQYEAEQAALAPAATDAMGQNGTADPLTRQVEGSKIRLIGKVESRVAGGYILGSVFGGDNYTVKLDQTRPDFQFVNTLAHGGFVFLQSPETLQIEGSILDLDVYPMGKYVSSTGDTMPAFTTDDTAAKAYLKFKLSKGQ